MAIFLFADNATSLLASSITNVQTTLNVTPTQGAFFPTPAAGQQFAVTVEDTSGNQEVMYCTGRTSDTLTVVRGAEVIPSQVGGPALAFASGSRVEMRVTSGILNALLQKNGGDVLAGSTTVNGVLQLGSSGSVQGGEFTGFVRSGPGVTAGEISVSGGAGFVGAPATANQILTAGNAGTTIAPSTSGLDFIRTNMIVFWHGTLGSVPTGWHICDGTSGTPDLRDQFIVGGDGALPTSGTFTAPTGVGFVTGALVGAHVLVTAELPVTSFSFDYFFGNASGPIFATGAGPGANFFTGSVGAGVRNSFTGTNAGGGQGHVHPISDSVGHTHAQEIPYTALFMIMKL
jgi:hypothetical protein